MNLAGAAPPIHHPSEPAPAGKTLRQRSIDFLDSWVSEGEDHGVEAFDPELTSHQFEPYAIGSFAIVRTSSGRVYALIRVHTVLGHLCLAIHLERHATRQLITTGFDFGDIVHAVSHVADDIGHAVSSAAKGIAHGVEGAVKDLGRGASQIAHGAVHAVKSIGRTAAQIGSGIVHAAQSAINAGAHAIETAAKAAGGAISSGVKAAAHLVMRAHLGDLSASNIVKGIVNAAKSGVELAKNAANTLAQGVKLVTKAIDLPKLVADAIPIPAIKGFVSSVDPLQKFGDAIDALRKGDMNKLKKIATETLSMAQGVISLVPGIGTGISAAISTAEALLQGGSPIDVAIRTAYGAIPIPPGIRQVTDSVLDAILAIVDGKNITDATLAVARDRIPAGIPRDVFDTLANIVVKHQPILKATGDLAGHYIKQYTQGIGDALAHGLEHTVGPAAAAVLGKLPDPKTVFASFPAELKQATHGIAGDVTRQLRGAAEHLAAQAASTIASPASLAAMHVIPFAHRPAVALRLPHPSAPSLPWPGAAIPLPLALAAHHA
jgi:hypothetical protein